MKIIINEVPMSQSRPRFNSYTKKAYEKADITNYKKRVGYAAKQVIKKPIEKGIALKIDVVFYMQTPKSVSNIKKNAVNLRNEVIRVTKKPDIDNLLKAILDSLNGIAFDDDNQITDVIMKKRYSLTPRIEIDITEVGDLDV